MGRCDQGIKFCSKIQSAWNHFKSDESVGLIVANPTQLVWVQTDIGSEIYRVLFKMTNIQKMDTDCTVRTDDDVADRTDDVADQMLTWQTIGIWRVLLAANGNATRGPIKGRHVSLACWLKPLHSAGVDPVTSGGRVKLWERLPNRCAHACSLLCMCESIYLTLL
jgi:hypothetical protein